MPKNKLERFAELETFPNCIYMPYEVALADRFPLKGKWNETFLKNNFPIVLELGCGKGEYTVGLAQKFPAQNFIGVDIKGNRMWVGAKKALEEKLGNAAFLRTRIDMITSAFGEGEVSAIWITFPDPHPTRKGEKKRLTSPRFLDRYKKILRPNASIRLKTDNVQLYEYTLDVIKAHRLPLVYATSDLYARAPENESIAHVQSIQTFYEKGFLAEGLKICYIEFRLD